MLERGLSVRHARLIAVFTAAVLAPLALSAAASGQQKTATKMCGSGNACATSLSSAAPPTVGSGGGGSGGGGSGSSTPPTPSSTFNVMAMASTPTAPPITSGSQMVETLNKGRRLTCLGYKRKDPSWFAFMLRTQTSIRITYLISDTITDTTPSQVHFCLGAPYRFVTFSGKQARRTTLPDGTLGFAGLLPLCRALPTPATKELRPCVVSARARNDSNSSTGVDTVLTLRVPAVTKGGDPWGGG